MRGGGDIGDGGGVGCLRTLSIDKNNIFSHNIQSAIVNSRYDSGIPVNIIRACCTRENKTSKIGKKNYYTSNISVPLLNMVEGHTGLVKNSYTTANVPILIEPSLCEIGGNEFDPSTQKNTNVNCNNFYNNFCELFSFLEKVARVLE